MGADRAQRGDASERGRVGSQDVDRVDREKAQQHVRVGDLVTDPQAHTGFPSQTRACVGRPGLERILEPREPLALPPLQFEPRLINPQVERLFHEVTAHEEQPIRQVCINFWNLQPLELEPNLFNHDVEYKRRELHYALEQVEARYGKRCVKTGTRLLLEKEAEYLVGDKPKCPFMPQREIGIKMNNIPEVVSDLTYEDEWKPLEIEAPTAPLPLPRTWGRSTSRTQKFV